MSNYIIDLKTKKIIPQENEPVVLVMGEHLSQSITFECERFFNGKDLKENVNLAIHYINADGTTDIDSSEDTAANRHNGGQVYVDTAEDNEDKIIISWIVGQIFTNAAGIGKIAIQFYLYADEKTKEFEYCLRTEEIDIEIKDSFLAKSNLIYDKYKYEQFLSDRNIPYEYNKVFIIDNKDIKPFTKENYDTSVVGDNGVTKLYFLMNDNIDGVQLSNLNAVTFMVYYKTPTGDVGFDSNVISTIDKDWGYCLLTWEIPGKICLNEGDVYYSVGFSYTENEVNKRWFTKVSTIHIYESSVLVTGEDIGVEDSFLQDLLTRLAIVENKTSDVNMGQYLRITGGEMFGNVTWHKEDNFDYSVTLNSNGVNIKDNSTTYYSKLTSNGIEIGDQDISTKYNQSKLKFKGVGGSETTYGEGYIDYWDDVTQKQLRIDTSSIKFTDDDPINEDARVTELKYSGLNTELVDTNKLIVNNISSNNVNNILFNDTINMNGNGIDMERGDIYDVATVTAELLESDALATNKIGSDPSDNPIVFSSSINMDSLDISNVSLLTVDTVKGVNNGENVVYTSSIDMNNNDIVGVSGLEFKGTGDISLNNSNINNASYIYVDTIKANNEDDNVKFDSGIDMDTYNISNVGNIQVATISGSDNNNIVVNDNIDMNKKDLLNVSTIAMLGGDINLNGQNITNINSIKGQEGVHLNIYNPIDMHKNEIYNIDGIQMKDTGGDINIYGGNIKGVNELNVNSIYMTDGDVDLNHGEIINVARICTNKISADTANVITIENNTTVDGTVAASSFQGDLTSNTIYTNNINSAEGNTIDLNSNINTNGWDINFGGIDGDGNIDRVNALTAQEVDANTVYADTFIGDLEGNADTATKLATARTIALSGAATGAATSFDGTKNITIPVTTLDATKLTGMVPIASIPQAALERLIPVVNQAARFALTPDDVQLGDTVKEQDTGKMHYVVDTSNLDSEEGYEVYTAGAATSATSDSKGQNIASTYIKDVSLMGRSPVLGSDGLSDAGYEYLKITKGDNSTSDIKFNTFTTDKNGLVPAPLASTSAKFLRDDGTWVAPNFLSLDGGTMAGDIDMNNYNITGAMNIIAHGNIATDGGKINTAGGDINTLSGNINTLGGDIFLGVTNNDTKGSISGVDTVTANSFIGNLQGNATSASSVPWNGVTGIEYATEEEILALFD